MKILFGSERNPRSENDVSQYILSVQNNMLLSYSKEFEKQGFFQVALGSKALLVLITEMSLTEKIQ